MEMSIQQVVILLGFIAFLQIAATATDTVCPGGYEKIHRGCYKFVEEELDWDEALAHCKESNNGELSVIISVKERDDVQKHLAARYPSIQSWWIGFKREVSKDWAWLDGTALDSNIIPWNNQALKTMKRALCGTIETKDSKFLISGARCSTTKPFICEYHPITERATDATTPLPTEAPAAADSATYLPTTLEPVIPETTVRNTPVPDPTVRDTPVPDPTVRDTPVPDPATPPSFVPNYFPSQNDRDCNTDDIKVDYSQLVKRLSSTDDPLYQQYLQSEINANAAKITFYDQVARVYAATLEKQNEWYTTSQAKLQMEIDQLKRGTTCP